MNSPAGMYTCTMPSTGQTRVAPAWGSAGVGVAVGGAGVGVGGGRVAVGTGVEVGTGVAVAGGRVAVGGAEVAVAADEAAGPPHAANSTAKSSAAASQVKRDADISPLLRREYRPWRSAWEDYTSGEGEEAEVRSQKSEVRGQRSEVRGERSEVSGEGPRGIIGSGGTPRPGRADARPFRSTGAEP